ncbi:MAG: hypothetical protein R3B72_29855 [Polyangiaceae bacterium]
MNSPLRLSLTPPGPVDLPRVLGTGFGLGEPSTRREGEAFWRATRVTTGPVTIRAQLQQEQIAIELWGAGRDEAVERLEGWLGFFDQPQALVPKDDVVARAQKRHPGLRLSRGFDIFEVLLPTILGQRVTGREAMDSWRQIVWRYGERAPGPLAKLWVPPSPAALRGMSFPRLNQFGVELARARVFVGACHHEAHIRRAAGTTPKKAIGELRKLSGIGPWTAHLTVAKVHGYPDAMPLGDYHIPSVVSHALTGEERADDRRMVELLAPYVGQRWRVIRLIGADAKHAPRRGARRAPWQVQVDLATARAERRGRRG